MNKDLLSKIRKTALAALRPPPMLKLSEWIERNVVLPSSVSATPGSVRIWPFQREIADAIGDAAIERVTLVKSVRVGLSTLVTSAVAGYVANDPGPMLLLLPTESDCRDFVVSDLEPIFQASPALNGLFSSTPEGDGADRETLLSKRFPGGFLKIVAAKSPRNLRRHNVRVLLIDEADAMEPGREGSAILLAEKRTLSFGNRKIILGSTPVFADTSNVLRSYAQSDQRIYEVPCPECGEFTEILWRHIVWPEGKPEQAAFGCPHCGSIVEERHKPQMVAAGRWRATQPHVRGHAGFKINALVSTLANASWGKLAAEFRAAKNDPELLKVFTNTILAEGWNHAGEVLQEGELAMRAEEFSLDLIPAEVLIVTAGIDVQRDRLEVGLCGWTEAGECLVLAHKVIYGLPSENATWTELDGLLSTRWRHELGGSIGVDAAFVDSGDGVTQKDVYAFAFPRYARKIMACKGAPGFSRPWIEMAKVKTGQRGRMFIVGVDTIKSAIFDRLRRGKSIRFSKSLPAVWYEQLCSEQITTKYTRGQPVRRFERIPGRDAEALDCTVYGFAARQIVQVNFEQRRDDLSRSAPIAAQKVEQVARSSWMKRR